MQLCRRHCRRHRTGHVDAWWPCVVRVWLLCRRHCRRHRLVLGLTIVSRAVGPAAPVPTASLPTAQTHRRAAVGQTCADGHPGCAEATLCRRHRRGPTARQTVPTALVGSRSDGRSEAGHKINHRTWFAVCIEVPLLHCHLRSTFF
jgi:hypothetical protein